MATKKHPQRGLGRGIKALVEAKQHVLEAEPDIEPDPIPDRPCAHRNDLDRLQKLTIKYLPPQRGQQMEAAREIERRLEVYRKMRQIGIGILPCDILAAIDREEAVLNADREMFVQNEIVAGQFHDARLG